MKVKTVTYKRVKNLGNYQTETLEMTAEIDDWEDYTEAAETLRTRVNRILFPDTPPSSPNSVPF